MSGFNMPPGVSPGDIPGNEREIRACSTCRYWSEMIAMTIGPAVSAMCLKKDGPKHGAMTVELSTCAAWQSGHLGAVDAPGQNPARYEIERQEP